MKLRESDMQDEVYWETLFVTVLLNAGRNGSLRSPQSPPLAASRPPLRHMQRHKKRGRADRKADHRDGPNLRC